MRTGHAARLTDIDSPLGWLEAHPSQFAKKASVKPEYRRMPTEALASMALHASEFISMPAQVQAFMAFSAGSLIAFGAALSVFLSVGVTTTGVSNLLSGLGFTSGFFMVIATGSALFTEVNVAVPLLMMTLRKVKTAVSTLSGRAATIASGRPQGKMRHLLLKCVKFWAIVWIFNLMGAMFVALIFRWGLVWTDEARAKLAEIMVKKVEKFKDNGAAGWFQVVASAFLGNWLVGLAAFLATSARTLPGKIVAVFFPVLSFVSLGVQHSPANMGFFMHGLICIDDPPVGWGDTFAWNIIPASLGNLLGGAFVVAGGFFYAFVQMDAELWEQAETALDSVGVGDGGDDGDNDISPSVPPIEGGDSLSALPKHMTAQEIHRKGSASCQCARHPPSQTHGRPGHSS